MSRIHRVHGRTAILATAALLVGACSSSAPAATLAQTSLAKWSSTTEQPEPE